jgi:phospholipid N-methyltransferase
MPFSDSLVFLRAWLRDPRSMGAVAPSGPALARLITANIDHLDGPVIELGPGTGVFTRALIARGVPARQLALIEADPAFADALARRYPQARVLSMDAAMLGETRPLFGARKASAVVSGLPLLSMPADKVAAIIAGAFAQQLSENGSFYQFTYARRCPLPRGLLEKLGLEAERIGCALLNLPPASVFRFRRRTLESVAA